MATTFGARPEDTVADSRGNVLSGVVLSLYPTQTDATNQTSLIATVSTNSKGLWPYSDASSRSLLWVRDPNGAVWPTGSQEALAAVGGKADQTYVDTALSGKEPTLSTYRTAGSGDERAAINAWLAQPSPLGVKQLIGSCSVSGPLTPSANANLDLNAATITQTSSSTHTLDLSAAGVRVRGGNIVGKGTDYVAGSPGAPTAIGAKVTANNCSIEGTTFTNHAGAGIYLAGVTGFRGTGFRVAGLGSASIPANDSSQFGVYANTGCSNLHFGGFEVSDVSIGFIASHDTTHMTITGARAHDIPGQHGFYLQNGTGLNVTGVDVWNTNLNGVKVQLTSSSLSDSFGMNISGITANGCGDCALSINNTQADLTSSKKFRGVTISNVAAYNCSRGVYLGSVRGATVSGVAAHSSTTDGLTVIDCQDVVITGFSSLGSGRLGVRITTQTGAANARLTFRGLKIRDAAGTGTASNTYGVQVSGVTGSDGVDLTFDGLEVTSTNVLMDYGFYFASGDQESLTLRDVDLRNAISQDIRLAAGPRAVKEFSNVKYGSSLNLPAMATNAGAVMPSVHTLVGMNYDPLMATAAQTAMTAGVLYVSKVPVPNQAKLSTIWFGLAASGATLTAGQNLIGVYDSLGNLLASTGDASATFSAAAGNKSIALTAPVTVPSGSFVYVAVLWNGTTSPQFRGINGTSLPNIGIATAAQSRFATGGTAQTALPSTLPALTAANGATSAPWLGIA